LQAEKGRAEALSELDRLKRYAADKDAQVADLMARLAACEAAGDALRKEVCKTLQPFLVPLLSPREVYSIGFLLPEAVISLLFASFRL
jgi:hypothetical protein